MGSREESMIYMGKFVHVYKITIQKGNHIGKGFKSKKLKSNQGVRISGKAGVIFSIGDL